MVVKLNRKYVFAAKFANLATTAGISPHDLALLCKWADVRAESWVRINNGTALKGDVAREQEAREEFRFIASLHGFDAKWEAIAPTLIRRRDKMEFRLPD